LQVLEQLIKVLMVELVLLLMIMKVVVVEEVLVR
jgi:hypothetical protein